LTGCGCTLCLFGGLASEPYGFTDIIIGQLIEDAVRGKRNEIMLL